MTEGIDLPRISIITLFRNVGSLVCFSQALGRACRKLTESHVGKDEYAKLTEADGVAHVRGPANPERGPRHGLHARLPHHSLRCTQLVMTKEDRGSCKNWKEMSVAFASETIQEVDPEVEGSLDDDDADSTKSDQVSRVVRALQRWLATDRLTRAANRPM